MLHAPPRQPGINVEAIKIQVGAALPVNEGDLPALHEGADGLLGFVDVGGTRRHAHPLRPDLRFYGLLTHATPKK
jgi:hypothetical protein